jgi:hypothetical protein
MLRNYWIALGIALLSAKLALAQLPGQMPMPTPNPYGNPGAFGYPGYPQYGQQPANPMLPYGGASAPGYPQTMPMPPMSPYGGMMPYPYGGMQNGNPLPVPIPPDPRRPVPIHDEPGPTKGATEPYMVGPEQAPTGAPATKLPTLPPKDAPGATAPAPAADPAIEEACYGPATPAEPYTLYEGCRYLQEVKQDNVSVWGQLNYIHWWVRHDSTPPLLTTGNPSGNAGTLGNPDTRVLYANGPVDPHEFTGIQAALGMWLDPERLTSLEVSGFYLGKNSRQYNFASDANGNNLIARPIITSVGAGGLNTETSTFVAFPGLLAGSANFSTVMSFHGAELDFSHNITRLCGWSVDWLAGFRYLYLNDTLTSQQSSTVLPGGAGLVTFQNVALPAGANLAFHDSFNLTNRFYGGVLGLRADYLHCCGVDVSGVVKIAFGDTNHVAIIDGTTTLTNAGATSTAQGGAYAQPSNIGAHYNNDFTVVTELSFAVGYQILPHVRLIAGYNMIYWPRVERAGAQIDRTIDPGQSSTGPGAFVAGTAAGSPRFLNTHSDFWAQGFNLGVEVKY